MFESEPGTVCHCFTDNRNNRPCALSCLRLFILLCLLLVLKKKAWKCPVRQLTLMTTTDFDLYIRICGDINHYSCIVDNNYGYIGKTLDVVVLLMYIIPLYVALCVSSFISLYSNPDDVTSKLVMIVR